MGQKKLELTEKARVSRLWAQYRQLPEAYKQGFFDIARSLAWEAGRQKQLIQREADDK
jgi:predicted DNA binding protein